MTRCHAWLTTAALGCAGATSKDLEVPEDVAVDILEPFDGRVAQHTVVEVFGQAVFADPLNAGTTWTQWTSEPASALASADCTETVDGSVLESRCALDTSAPIEWLGLDVGTDGPDGLVSGSTVMVVVWHDNDVPEVVIEAPASGETVATAVEVALSLADDGAAEVLTVAWSSDVQGALTADDATVDAAGAYTATLVLDAGVHTLTVVVSDEWGTTATASVDVTVSEA